MSIIPELTGGRRLIHDAITEGAWISRGGPGNYVEIFEDFFGNAGVSGMTAPFQVSEDGSTGASGAMIASAQGEYRLLHSTLSETQAVAITTNGLNAVSPTQSTIFEARVKVTLSVDSTFDTASGYEVIVGLATAGSSASKTAGAFDGFADTVAFRLGGGSTAANNIYAEGDDGTTDIPPTDTGIDFVSGTFVKLKIDMTNLASVKFFIDDVRVLESTTFNLSAMAATDFLEPYILFARTSASGTERAHSLDVDYVHLSSLRS
tara:strand:+ start:743 stop:1531 length:789 start_codon:yes stop_codon:yes gene_type:complete